MGGGVESLTEELDRVKERAPSRGSLSEVSTTILFLKAGTERWIKIVQIVNIKAVSHDATSLMRFGFMKLVSPCGGAKKVSQETFKSPVRLFLR